MAVSKIPSQPIVTILSHTIGELSAGAKGYTTVPAPTNLVGRNMLAFNVALGHPAGSNGLQVTGGVGINGKIPANIYLNYYAPTAVQADQSDLWITILHSD